MPMILCQKIIFVNRGYFYDKICIMKNKNNKNKKTTTKIINYIFKIRFFLLYIFVLFFEINKLGIQIKEKIAINSSLDYSWLTDSIQRFKEGFILGKDFIFTYGPLFQLIYSLPTTIFDLPSYISSLLSPIISVTIVFLLLLLFVKLIEKTKNNQLIILTYLLFFVGLISYSSLDLIKMLIPLVFTLVWYQFLIKGKKISGVFLIPFLPTLFGAFSYDLFIYCFVISIILSLTKSLRKKTIYPVIPIFIVVIYQFLFSIILTRNLDYIFYSLDTIKNYSEILNSFWTFDRSNFLYIFPLILIFLLILLLKSKKIDKTLKTNLLVTGFTSLFLLYAGLIRSDHAHIIRSIYPSIISVFVFLYYFVKEKKQLVILVLILFLFIPYKTDYALSFSGIKNVISVLKTKPQFQNIYKFNEDYYLNNDEINKISSFIQKNKGDVFIYPYDNYLLNINDTTYNSFPLQFYQYSNSITEKKAIEKMNNNPPKFIIFMIDQKGALDLDNIPNLTRNTLFFKWALENYSLKTKENKYLILGYERNKKSKNTNNKKCNLCEILFLSDMNDSLDIFKKPIYYLNNMRIPKIKKYDKYIFSDEFNNVDTISSFFENAINFNTYYFLNPENRKMEIIKYSPFLKHKTKIELNNMNSKIYCFN